MEFILWLTKIGKSRATGYRWRDSGKVVTVNVDGKHFITSEEIKRFWARAAAGEFARKSSGACKGESDCGS
jgi:predicted site-specific integrase-resolvase